MAKKVPTSPFCHKLHNLQAIKWMLVSFYTKRQTFSEFSNKPWDVDSDHTITSS